MGLVFRNTLKNEGVGSFWKGIVWAWGREGSYASIKLGAYAPVRDAIGAGGKDGTYNSGSQLILMCIECGRGLNFAFLVHFFDTCTRTWNLQLHFISSLSLEPSQVVSGQSLETLLMFSKP